MNNYKREIYQLEFFELKTEWSFKMTLHEQMLELNTVEQDNFQVAF